MSCPSPQTFAPLTVQTTFLLDYRNGNASVGYVTTGYFAGVSLFYLHPLCRLLISPRQA